MIKNIIINLKFKIYPKIKTKSISINYKLKKIILRTTIYLYN